MRVKRATLEDLQSLVPRLRVEDRNELTAVNGENFTLNIARAIGGVAGYECYSIDGEEGSEALFGTGPSIGLGSEVFMVGTDRVIADPKLLLKTSKLVFEHWRKRDNRFFCFADARNDAHLRYLQHLKFERSDLYTAFGVERRPFYLMTRV